MIDTHKIEFNNKQTKTNKIFRSFIYLLWTDIVVRWFLIQITIMYRGQSLDSVIRLYYWIPIFTMVSKFEIQIINSFMNQNPDRNIRLTDRTKKIQTEISGPRTGPFWTDDPGNHVHDYYSLSNITLYDWKIHHILKLNSVLSGKIYEFIYKNCIHTNHCDVSIRLNFIKVN